MWRESASVSVTLLAIGLAAFALNDIAAFSSSSNNLCRAKSPSVIVAQSAFDDDEYEPPKKKGFFANFFEELDNFVDDATSRRLGAGAQYYGKRKSSFYGKDDTNKKRTSGFDPTGKQLKAVDSLLLYLLQLIMQVPMN